MAARRSSTCAASTARSSSFSIRSEEHTSELQSPDHLVCRRLIDKKMRAERELGVAEKTQLRNKTAGKDRQCLALNVRAGQWRSIANTQRKIVVFVLVVTLRAGSL